MDEQKQQSEEQVEDLDVPQESAEHITGGAEPTGRPAEPVSGKPDPIKK